MAFRVDENFAAYEEGMLAFISAGSVKEWRLVDLGDTGTEEWRPEQGWKMVDLHVDNMMEFMPRMGYLFTDGVFDLERVASGKQRFVVKDGGEERKKENVKKSQYKEFKYCMKVGEDWLGAGEGFEDVEMTETMMGDMGVNPEFEQEVINGEKKIVGKI